VLHCDAMTLGVTSELVLAEVALQMRSSQVVTYAQPLAQGMNNTRQVLQHACHPTRQHTRGGPEDQPPQHAVASLQAS